MALQR
jgi:translation elongation factor EF-1alpha